MKKKKRKVRVSKKDVSTHRKLLRKERRHIGSEQPAGIHFNEERYLQAVSNIKRKLLQVEENILFLLNNAEPAKDPERKQDLRYAHEYCGFARQNLGATEYFCTDINISTPTKMKKGKLNRPKKKGKLNRRRQS